MTARTLFSDSQPQLVARVLSNSSEDKLLSADTFLSMAEHVQCLLDDGHKPASLTAKGDKSQYDVLFWGESASPAPLGSSSSQVSADETVLHAASVSTATDNAMASSSSTPSTEGLQDHIESSLQRLPDKISLNQKSSPNSMVGANATIPPHNRQITTVNAFAYKPAGYETWNSGQPCRSWRNGQLYNLCKIVLAALSACAHHSRCVVRNNRTTVSPHRQLLQPAGWINDVR